MATLRLTGSNLDLDWVSAFLGQTPEIASRKGEVLYKNGRSTKARAQIDTWYWTTRDMVGHTPDQHLGRVIGMISDKIDGLRGANPDLRVDISLLAFDPHAAVGDHVRKQAEALGSLDIEVVAAVG